MLLRPAALTESFIGKPLPWDLYTASGVLISPAGLVIDDAAHLHKLQTRVLFRPADQDSQGERPTQTLLDLIHTLDALYDSPEQHEAGSGIRHSAGTLMALHGADPDATLGLTRLLDCRSGATRHCVLTAQFCLGIGAHLGMETDMLETLAAAALSMNIAAMKLHNELIDRNQPSREEMEAIQNHPGQAVDLLYKSGVSDSIWLDAVFQHHENMDGSGYPTGLRGKEISQLARILRVADLYAAKISGRYYRPPRSSLFAMHYLFGQERRKIDAQIAALLLRRYGFFPPGTLVHLANHETAVVTRVQERKNALRHVVSFLDGRNRPLERPAERDTQKPVFSVLRLADLDRDWPSIHWESVWGYA
jgi:HD-GYP domain-containing protein (c-di-GMP phosphodiesterase class II)